jgi:hypothetical protein
MFLVEKVTSGQYGIQGLPGSVEDTVWLSTKDVAKDAAIIGFRKDELHKLIRNLQDIYQHTYGEEFH